MGELISFLFLLGLGLIFGKLAEGRHYKTILEREEKYRATPLLNYAEDYEINKVKDSFLVFGSAVISVDFFKQIVSTLQSLVGGAITSYETLLDRAKREALLRMVENASRADVIVNVRLETCSLAGAEAPRNVKGVEVLAYGTAVRFK